MKKFLSTLVLFAILAGFTLRLSAATADPNPCTESGSTNYSVVYSGGYSNVSATTNLIVTCTNCSFTVPTFSGSITNGAVGVITTLTCPESSTNGVTNALAYEAVGEFYFVYDEITNVIQTNLIGTTTYYVYRDIWPSDATDRNNLDITTPTTVEVTNFNVTIYGGTFTNCSCYAPGVLTNYGTLSFSNATTFLSNSIVFPTLTNTAYSNGLIMVKTRTCDNPIGDTNFPEVTYSYTNYWDPSPPDIFTNTGVFYFTNIILGIPDTNVCSTLTNIGQLFKVYVTAVDTDADSDNNRTIDHSQNEDDMEDLEDDAEHPGQIITVNNSDADRDGVPNFADFESSSPVGPRGFGAEVSFTVGIPSTPYRSNFFVFFNYLGSDPNIITLDTNTSPPTYISAPGMARIWRAHDNEFRDPSALDDDGDYIRPNVPYTPAQLGFTNTSITNVTFFIEAVRHSGSAGDIRVALEIDTDGEGVQQTNEVDAIRFTAIDVGTAEAIDDSTLERVNVLKESRPVPYFSDVTVTLGNLRPSDDGSELWADLDISGEVYSDLCDITPGTNGIIDHIWLYVNGYADNNLTNGIPLSVTKTTNSNCSYLHPYPYRGTFNASFSGVPVDEENEIRLNVVEPLNGTVGYITFTNVITFTENYPMQQIGLPILYDNTLITLDFGTNVHSLAELRGTNPVSFKFEVLTNNYPGMALGHWEYNTTLYAVTNLSNSPLVLKGGQACVVITQTNEFNQGLNKDVRGTNLDLEVSIKGLIYSSLVYKVNETGTNTGFFAHDYVMLKTVFSGQPTNTVRENLTAYIYRVGGIQTTNYLTETDTNSLVFRDAFGTFEIGIAAQPSWNTNNVDSLTVVVDRNILDMTNYSIDLVETDTNSFTFATENNPIPSFPNCGSLFGYSFAETEFLGWGASDHGELHVYINTFLGPANVLDLLASKTNGPIIKTGCGQYAIRNSDDKPMAMVAFPVSPGGDLPPESGGSFAKGVLKGMWAGTRALVWDNWYALGNTLENMTLDPIIENAADLQGLLSGSVKREDFCINVVRRFGQGVPVLQQFGEYAALQLENPTNSELKSYLQGYVSYTAQQFDAKMHQTLAAGATLLTNLYNDLANGTQERRGEIVGRATFEISTFVATAMKASTLAKAGEVQQVQEAAVLQHLSQNSKLPEIRQTAQKLLASRALSSEEKARRASILARAQEGESLGLEFCIDKMKSLGWEAVDLDLSYSGHQGIDLVFKKAKAGGGFNYAVCEAKSGKQGLALLKKDSDGILRQGSHEYNRDRLEKLITSKNYGMLAPGQQQIVQEMLNSAKMKNLKSFAGMARAGKNATGLFYEIKLGWPASRNYERLY